MRDWCVLSCAASAQGVCLCANHFISLLVYKRLQHPVNKMEM